MLSAKIRRLHPGLMLLHYPDDLLFRKPALIHPSSPSYYESSFQWLSFPGAGHARAVSASPSLANQRAQQSPHPSELKFPSEHKSNRL
jgi:hypothetical protein